MRALGAAFAALGGAISDVLSPRLGALALLCLLLAGAATFAAGWAGFHFLVSRIAASDMSLTWFGWQVDVAGPLSWFAGAGLVVTCLLLAPGISMIVGGLLFDVAAARVEKIVGLEAGRAVSPGEGFANGFRIGWPALALNILALPLYFIPVLNLISFFWLNGFLMGREYAAVTAIRRMSWAEARAWRKRAPISIFLIGLVCSVIPFIAPLVGASAMTRFSAALTNTHSDKPR